MDSAFALARPTHRPLHRVAARLCTPGAYLALIGGLDCAYLWLFRPWFGVILPLLASVLLVALLVLLVAQPGAWGLKTAGLWLLVGVMTIAPTAVLVLTPGHGGTTFQHDGLVQTEAAIDRILKGEPIYGVDWSGTALGKYDWSDVGRRNPALHHHVYLPLTALVGVPVRVLSDATGMPFDYRAVLALFAVLGVAAVAALPIPAPQRFMVTVAVFLNPLITTYFLSGRNDISYVAVLLLALALLARGRPLAASVACGFAIALKPFALLAVPFLLAVLWIRWRGRPGEHRREVLLVLLGLAAVPLATITPFLLADPGAFWRDTVLFTNGSGPEAYPIGGFGFGALLLAVHLLPDPEAAFPFGLVQLAAVLPVGYWAVRRLLTRPTVDRWLGGYTALLLAFAFFARFFNDSYVGVVLALLAATLAVGSTPLLTAHNAAAAPGSSGSRAGSPRA
jgi:hypothetical protein